MGLVGTGSSGWKRRNADKWCVKWNSFRYIRYQPFTSFPPLPFSSYRYRSLPSVNTHFLPNHRKHDPVLYPWTRPDRFVRISVQCFSACTQPDCRSRGWSKPCNPTGNKFQRYLHTKARAPSSSARSVQEKLALASVDGYIYCLMSRPLGAVAKPVS